MHRRSLLAGAAAAAAALCWGATATAKAGTTLRFRAKNAPFPSDGGEYDDPTVFAFVPSFFRVPKSGRIDFVVHFHGHMTSARAAMTAHALREQITASRQNAILVVPQGPVHAADGDFGKLMKKGGLARLLDEVRRELAEGLGGARDVGRVVLSAHSGGYRAVAACLQRGGVDAREAYLFDALYGEVEAFRAFVAGAPEQRKLVSYYVGGRPRENSLALADALENDGVRVERERAGKRLTRAELVRARAAFLEGRASHATATYEEHALRDCLLASCLKGRGTRQWHRDRAARRAT